MCLYKLLDNVFAKVFKNSMISLLIVLQIIHDVKCTFLFSMLGGLGECVIDIAIQVAQNSHVPLQDGGITSSQMTLATITNNRLLD